MADEEEEIREVDQYFVGPYKVKGIILMNVVELSLPTIVKIHPVVNVSRLQLYKLQVEEQKVAPLTPVIVEEEEEYEVEKILNRRKVWGKSKFLVCWKVHTLEEDMWEENKSLKMWEN